MAKFTKTKTTLLASLAIVAVVGITVAILQLMPKKTVDPYIEEVPVNVVVSTVKSAAMPDAILLPATVEPFKSVKVAAEVAGVVEWVGVEEGASVSQGTLIAKIDTRTLEAELNSASSVLALAESNFKRVERLYAGKAASEDEFDQKKSQLEVARFAHETAKIRFDKGTISAPGAGVLNRRYIEAGEYVKSGDPVADVLQVDRVKVVIQIPEKDIVYISVGSPLAILADRGAGENPGNSGLPEIAEALLPEGKRAVPGKVTYRSVVADEGARTYRVEVTVDNIDGRILPGMIVRAVLLRRIIADAISVPLRAVVPREGRVVVYVEIAGRGYEREVKLGITDGTNIQILDGLSPGDMLVVEGQRQLRNDQAVSIRDPLQ